MKILCPLCKRELHHSPHQMTCENGHNFDIAKEGYVNFNLRSPASGDSEEMINARRRFLEKGYYDPMKELVNRYIESIAPKTLADFACGEGYYTKDMPAGEKIGFDLSKKGLKIASKRDKSTLYLLSSIYTTPLEDESLDMVTTLFAHIAEKEIVRVLKDTGKFLLVRPGAGHMHELKEVLYEEVRDNAAGEILIPGLKLLEERPLTFKRTLDHESLIDLFSMTPYAVKTGRDGKERLYETEELEVTFDFLISIYEKEKTGGEKI